LLSGRALSGVLDLVLSLQVGTRIVRLHKKLMHELFEFGFVLYIDFLSFLHKDVRLRRLRCLLEELLGLLLDELQGVLLDHDRKASLGRRSSLPQGLASEEQGLLRHRHDDVPKDVSAPLP
jgi:predicted AAA+ superfamily ATPase